MFGHLTDMAHDGEDLAQVSPMAAMPDQPKYPYGLHISLDKHALEKLGIDHDSFELGAVYHIQALVKCDSKSAHENEKNDDCNIGLQITHLAGPENEETEETPEINENENEDGPDLSKHGYLKYDY